MTEKRADYRKKQQKKKIEKFLDFKRFKRNKDQSSVNDSENDIQDSVQIEPEESSVAEDREIKINRLKKRLNYAILIVVVLLIIVLLALFKL